MRDVYISARAQPRDRVVLESGVGRMLELARANVRNIARPTSVM